jgi:ankyrin repeat protein
LDLAKNNGVTAIGIAAFSGNIKALDLLYKAGADINLTSKKGTNPLYLAIKANNLECVKYLVARKAIINLREPN